MSWRIYRYIIKEILPYFLLTLLIVTAIIFANEVGRFSELFVKRNVPPVLVRTLLGAVLTRILIITLPVSLLIGMLLGLARMSGDNEIISLLACGLSRKQLALPLLSLSAIVSLYLGILTFVEFPQAATTIREIHGQLILQGIRTQVKPRVFDDRFVNRVIYIADIDRKTDQWEGIFLASLESEQTVLMTGRRGILELGDQPESSKLHLFDGVAHRIEKDKDGKEIYHLEGFSSYHLRFDPESKEAARFQLEAQRRPEAIEEKSFRELMQMSPADKRQYVKARLEASRRLALPFACLLFAPIGLAIGLLRNPTGRSLGFVIGIVLATGYYLLLFAGEKLARAGLAPPLLSMWLANLVFALLALLGLKEQGLLEQWQASLRTLIDWRQRLLVYLKAHRREVVSSHRSGIWRWLPGAKLVDQYIVTDFLKFLFLCILSLWLIFMVFTLFELSPDIIEHQIGPSSLLRYFLFLSPQVLQTVAPPCVLIACLLVISILKRTNQIPALHSSGVSTYRMALPIILTSVMLAVLSSGWENYVVPRANIRQDELRFLIKKGRLPSSTELSLPSQQGNWFYGTTNRIFHFDFFDRDHDQFRRLLILELDERMMIRRRIEAGRAVWDPWQFGWLLSNAQVWNFDGDRLLQSAVLEQMLFRTQETPAYFKRDIKRPEYMSRKELTNHMVQLERRGLDVTDLRIALKRKLAIPMALLVMSLVGFPFGFLLGRKGALYGVGVGVLLGLLYWIGLGLFVELGRYGYIGAALAAWGPGGVFGAVGLYVLFRVRT